MLGLRQQKISDDMKKKKQKDTERRMVKGCRNIASFPTDFSEFYDYFLSKKKNKLKHRRRIAFSSATYDRLNVNVEQTSSAHDTSS